MIEVTKQQWSKDAAEGLKLSLAGDLQAIADEVQAGIAELWSVGGHGYVITRFEINGGKKELVLVAGEGFKKDGIGYIESVKAFCNIAAAAGAETVRAHSSIKGIGRLLQSIGFNELERVYRLVI